MTPADDRQILDHYRTSSSWTATARHFGLTVALVKKAVQRSTRSEHLNNYRR